MARRRERDGWALRRCVQAFSTLALTPTLAPSIIGASADRRTNRVSRVRWWEGVPLGDFQLDDHKVDAIVAFLRTLTDRDVKK